jgi:hypothetical protein
MVVHRSLRRSFKYVQSVRRQQSTVAAVTQAGPLGPWASGSARRAPGPLGLWLRPAGPWASGPLAPAGGPLAPATGPAGPIYRGGGGWRPRPDQLGGCGPAAARTFNCCRSARLAPRDEAGGTYCT